MLPQRWWRNVNMIFKTKPYVRHMQIPGDHFFQQLILLRNKNSHRVFLVRCLRLRGILPGINYDKCIWIVLLSKTFAKIIWIKWQELHWGKPVLWSWDLFGRLRCRFYFKPRNSVPDPHYGRPPGSDLKLGEYFCKNFFNSNGYSV